MRIVKNYGIWLLAPVLLVTVYSSLLPRVGKSATAAVAAPSVPQPSPADQATRPQSTTATPATRQPQPTTSATAQQVAQSTAPATRQTQAAPVAKAIPLVKQHTKFTQTEAYLQDEKLRTAVLKTFYGDYEPVKHMDLVSRVMAKEAEMRDTHWAFYHGLDNAWNVWQDVYTELYNHFNPSAAQEDNKFIFLRTRGYGKDMSGKSVKDFLVGSLKEHGLVDDNNEAGGMLLSTNVSLFGNTGRQGRGECTWFYLMKDQDHRLPSAQDYENIMKEFNLPNTLVNRCLNLAETLKSKQQTLLQIFVPKNLVDDIGYVAWATGIPAQDKAIGWVQSNVKNKTFEFKNDKPGRLWALEDLKSKFKNQQNSTPEIKQMFNEMLKEIEEGAYSLNEYLTFMCNKPLEVPNMNTVQGRFLFSDQLLLNPQSGIKMFRHDGAGHDQVKEYRRQLNALIKDIVKK
jgi:hypothetical protein